MAMIHGRRAPVYSLRIWRVASRPSMSGIWMSIRMTSYFCRSSASQHFDAVLDDVGPIAHLAEDARGHLLVDDVVLRQKDAQRTALAEAGVDAAGGAQQLVGDLAALERRGENAVQLLEMDRLGQAGDKSGRKILAVGGLLLQRAEQDARARWPRPAGGECPARDPCPIGRASPPRSRRRGRSGRRAAFASPRRRYPSATVVMPQLCASDSIMRAHAVMRRGDDERLALQNRDWARAASAAALPSAEWRRGSRSPCRPRFRPRCCRPSSRSACG